MPAKKAKAIYVLKILQEESDEHHILSAKDIVKKLSQYGLDADRRTVYDAVALLQELGYDISTYGDNKKGYFLCKRHFEPSEIALLTDAVYAFPFISDSRTKELVDKLQKTQSCYQRKPLRHLRAQRTGVKTENPEVFLNLDVLDEAIEIGCKVSFVYLKYDLSKKIVPRRAERYTVSPYGMVFCNEHYYLACVMADEESASLYRLDRMRDIQIRQEKADQKQSDLEKEVSAAIYAFMGVSEQITLLCKNHVLDDIIDKFGSDIHVRKADEEHLRVTVSASTEGMKYWALQYLSCVEVMEPERLRAEIIENLKSNPYLSGRLSW